jgi:thioredoxin-like negative regulator of GroEL
MSGPVPVLVELISRRGCHLCDEMKTMLERLQKERPFVMRVVDVDSDPGLVLYYSHRVPVLRVDGKSIAELRVPEDELRQRVLASLESLERLSE